MLFCLLLLFIVSAESLEVTWYGHSAFRLKSNKDTVVFIDPWISNPYNSSSRLVLEDLKRAHYILITHGHGDAIGDSLAILKQTKAKVITSYYLAQRLIKVLNFPEDQVPLELQLDVGGEVHLYPDINLVAVMANHSSMVSDASGNLLSAGPALGFIINFEGDKTIYHTGDTGIFMDMKYYSSLYYDIDILFVPIGGQFTMGPRTAALATSLIAPKTVVPMRYRTFKSIKGTPEEFQKYLGQFGYKGKIKTLSVNRYYDI